MIEGFGDNDPTGRAVDDEDVLVSQSLVGSYDLCAASVGQKGLPGYILQPNQQMSWGSMLHGAIEQDLLGLLAGVELHRWTPDQLEDQWNLALQNERDGTWLLSDMTKDRVLIRHWLDEAVVAMYKWQDDVLPYLGLDVLATTLVEETRARQIGTLPNGRRVFYGGTGDLVEPAKGQVTDWKTSGRGWHQSKADFTGQVPGYLWLYEQEKFRFVVWNRQKLTWDTFDTFRTEREIDAYLRHAFEVGAAIDAGIYPVTNVQSNFGKYNRTWQCSPKWCGAWNICPYKYLNDDKWEQQVADPADGWK